VNPPSDVVCVELHLDDASVVRLPVRDVTVLQETGRVTGDVDPWTNPGPQARTVQAVKVRLYPFKAVETSATLRTGAVAPGDTVHVAFPDRTLLDVHGPPRSDPDPAKTPTRRQPQTTGHTLDPHTPPDTRGFRTIDL
jgi:hypothetical protein